MEKNYRNPVRNSRHNSFRSAIPLCVYSLFHALWVPAKVSNISIGWHLTGRPSQMLAVCILMRGRDEINNGFAAGASFSPLARLIFLSPFPFLAPAKQAMQSRNELQLPISLGRHAHIARARYNFKSDFIAQASFLT